MATDPEIKDGFTLPIWMKSKPNKDFEPFARSPPPPEDSFFYIRYPKPEVLLGKSTMPSVDQQVSQVLEDSQTTSTKYSAAKDKDWSKHTKPCQEVLHSMMPINNVNLETSKLKPAGTDDGFKGEGAACGNSIVKMAHEIVQSKGGRGGGFTVAAPTDDAQEPAEPPPANHARLTSRRGSKSLPVTPSSSPTSRRKNNANRYFTSPFEPAENSNGRSWLSMALLGLKKDLAASTSTLAEEDYIESRLHVATLAESVENLGPAPRGRETKFMSGEASTIETQTTKPKKSPRSFLPKPSELREMNFWSPTSM